MLQITYLRYLRLRYGIGLPELARQAGVSPQQLSRLELRQVPCTKQQEIKVCNAVEGWIKYNREQIMAVEEELRRCQGHLLSYMEEDEHEL